MLIEIMDQDGAHGPYVGFLQKTSLHALQAYLGSDALKSEKIYMVQTLTDKALVVPHGFLADAFTKSHWPVVSADRLHHTSNPSVDFISHLVKALGDTCVVAAKVSDKPFISWTMPSSDQARINQQSADVTTFQGFLP